MTRSHGIEVTQYQAGVAILGLAVFGAWAALILNTITNGSSNIATFGIAAFVITTLLFVYWRFHWRYAPHTLMIFYTALIAFGLPEPYVTQKLTLVLLTPPLLALVLLDAPWIVGVGLITLAGALVRAGGRGPLGDDPMMLFIGVMAVGMIVLGRMVTTTALLQAERNARLAGAERALAEKRSTELAEANTLVNEQLNRQRRLLDLITALETPVIQIADGVLLAPIVGQIDSQRAEKLTQHLLKEAYTARTRHVVLDIAGVQMVDSQVAHALINTTKALRLLGCAVTISGISSRTATTLTHLGILLDDINVARSPQEALNQSGTAVISARARLNN